MTKVLKNFEMEELQIVLEHLKLGPDHLKKQLSEKQFKELENYGFISKREKKELEIDKRERFSQLAMVLNSVVTGIFGVWMGFATAMEIDVTSNLLHTAGLSLLCGGLMGISILLMKKRESLDAFSHLKIQNFELKILEAIQNKQKEKLNDLLKKLKTRYQEIEGKRVRSLGTSFEKKEEFSSWFYLFQEAVVSQLNQFPVEKIFQHFKDKILNILKKTEDYFIEKGEIVGDFAQSLAEKEPIEAPAVVKKHYTSLEILVNPSLSTPKTQVKKSKWYKQDAFKLLFDLFPTLLGAFGSILMWCNSTTLLSKIFHLQNPENYISLPCVPYAKILISFFFTINFVFFYYYSQKKSLQRKHNIEFKRKTLLAKETAVVQFKQQLDLLFFLDSQIDEIIKYLDYVNFFKVGSKNEAKAFKTIASKVIAGKNLPLAKT